jgi:methylmalonyl-CoA epimerase
MVIKGVHHIAIAVRNTEEAKRTFSELLGVEPSQSEEVPEQGVKATLFHLGPCEIELLEPIDPEAGVAKFLERRGEGLHHVCLEVDDIDEELKALATKGTRLIDQEPRRGLAGRIAFLHPQAANGVLIELAQRV